MATEEYVSQLTAALDSLQVRGANSYSWRGTWHQVLPRAFRASLAEKDIRSCLMSAIEGRLYRHYYTVGGIHADPDTLQAASSHASTLQFVDTLSAANHGVDHFDPGWCVPSVGHRSMTIMKDGLRLTANSTDCRSDKPILQGVNVSLRTSKECFGRTPGFYLVLGSAPGPLRGSADTLVRLYWNVTPTGAVRLVDELTRLLNKENIAFRLKALRDPAAYQRCDAAVLYISKKNLLSLRDALTEVYGRISVHIKHGTPAMTKLLAHGLGLAEDPGQSTSFGLHRCSLIAEGMVRAADARTKDPKIRLTRVAERFAEEGIEITRPYLNAGSRDDYPSIIVRKSRKAPSEPGAIGRGHCLEAAVAIGQALVESALYSKDSCTWAGYHPGPLFIEGAKSTVFGTVGPALYDGNAGIAWFLSELFAVTHDDDIGRCAAAALNAALAAATSMPSALFAGWMGVALSAAYCSQHLSSPTLHAGSLDLLNLLSERSLPAGSDLLSGSAGIITGLLLQARLLQRDELVKEAAALGGRLMEAAERRADRPGASWASNVKQTHPNLTGLSHGVSGVVLALLQLYGATGRAEFRDCAHQGVLYERALFDSQHQNWPDLRGARKRANLPMQENRYLNFWCHGAPGIGVSRLAGWRCLNSADYLDEARIAFRSTHAWTSRSFAQGQCAGCLCHGVAGNAMVLMHAEAAGIRDDAESHGDLANAVASRVARQVLEGKPLIGEAMRDIDNPSLMLGVAGIGHFLLRLSVVRPSGRFLSPLWLD